MRENWYNSYFSLDDSGKSAYREQVAKWLAATMAAIPPAERDRVWSQAKGYIRSEELAYAEPFKAIPAGTPMGTVAKIVAGLYAQLEALLQSTPEQTVDQVIEVANSIATGVPVGGDPADHPNLPSAAAVLLDSGLRHGHPDLLDPEVVEALIALDQLYDCAQHAYPLGGGLLDGLKSWWKGNFGSDEDKIAYQEAKQAKTAEAHASSAALARSKAITKLVKQGMSVEEATQLVDANSQSSIAEPADVTPQLDVADISRSVATAAEDATRSLTDMVEAAKVAMKESSRKLQAQKDQAEASKLKLARLKFAEAALNASDDAAKLMADTNADYGSVGGALQTGIDLLAAGKQSGDIPTLRIFSRVLSGLKRKSSSTGDWVESLLSGDASEFYAKIAAPEDSRAAEGLREFLRAKGAVEDIFSKAPQDVKEEVIEL